MAWRSAPSISRRTLSSFRTRAAFKKLAGVRSHMQRCRVSKSRRFFRCRLSSWQIMHFRRSVEGQLLRSRHTEPTKELSTVSHRATFRGGKDDIDTQVRQRLRKKEKATWMYRNCCDKDVLFLHGVGTRCVVAIVTPRWAEPVLRSSKLLEQELTPSIFQQRTLSRRRDLHRQASKHPAFLLDLKNLVRTLVATAS